MAAKTGARLESRNIAARLLAGFVATAGAMVMLGWWLRQPQWVQIAPGFVGMTFNTALCFVLSASALLLPANHPRLRHGQAVLGGVVALLAAAVLSQTVTGRSLGIDRLFVEPWLRDPNPHPGRMAPNTAAAFIATGIVLVLVHRVRERTGALLVHLLTFAVLFIAMMSLLMYAMRLELLYAGWNFTRMAVHTAAGFLLLGLALWIYWHRLPWCQSLYRAREDLRIGVIAGMLLASVALIAGLSSFALLKQQADETLRRGLSLSLQNRIDLFTGEIQNAMEHARVVANRPSIVQHLQRLTAAPNDAAERERMRKTVAGFLPLGFAALRFYDANGRALVAMGEAAEAESSSVRRIALPNRPASLIWADGYLLRVQVPIVLGDRRLGTLVTEQPLSLLTRIHHDYQGLGDTGEMAICNDAHDFMECFPLRAAPGVQRLPRVMDGEPLPMHYALLGHNGVVIAKDYRRKYVMAAHAPIGDLGLGMVLKIDTAELYRPIAAPLQLVLVLLVALIAVGVAVINWQVVPIVRRLRQSEEAAQRHNEALRESELRFRSVTDSANDAVIVADAAGRITLWNPAAQRVFGYRPDEAIGQPLSLILPPRDRATHQTFLTPALDGGASPVGGQTMELLGQRKDGGAFPLEVSLSSWQSPTGWQITGLVRDITRRKQGEESTARLAAIVESSDDAIISRDLAGTITSWNAAAEQLYGYRAHEIVGRPVLVLLPPERHAEEKLFVDKIVRGEHVVRHETVRRHKDGHDLQVALTVSPVRDATGRIIGASKIARDISERKRAEELIRQLSLVDELTGLQNRRGFFHQAEPALKLARRAQRELYLFFVDLDGMKQINDGFGHAMGDAALLQTAKILRTGFRDSDIIARLGGDEFVVLALETRGHGAQPMIDRLQRLITAFNTSGTHPFTLAMSIGAVRYDPTLNPSLDQLLAEADTLMYQQKPKRRA